MPPAAVRRLSPIALAVLLAGCGLTLPTTPSPTPAPSASEAAPAPTIAPPTVATVAASIDALDELDSYRFSQRLDDESTDGPSRATGIVINGDVHRSRIDYTSGGAFAGGTITIGPRRWQTVNGRRYVEQEGAAALEEAWTNPVALQLDPYGLGLDQLEDAGTEDRDGVQARHLHGTLTAKDAVDAEGLPIGMGFIGTVDAWIAVDGGYLVAAHADGVRAWPAEDEGQATPPPTTYRLDIAVEGVDDPANAVDEPGAGTETPGGGDAAAARLVKGIAAGQASLHSYVYELTSSSGGFDLTARLTVVDAGVPAAQLETDPVSGLEGTTILVSGSRTWTRTGAGPWQRGSTSRPPRCSPGGNGLLDPLPCTFERLTGVDATLRSIRDTFSVIAADESIGGVAVTHLRSDAGLASGDLEIPGTRDVWIANDGGYLVRDVFTGQGISSIADLRRVDDPRNVIAIP